MELEEVGFPASLDWCLELLPSVAAGAEVEDPSPLARVLWLPALDDDGLLELLLSDLVLEEPSFFGGDLPLP